MKSIETPADEADRLMELYSYKILDTVEESDFDALTELASGICEAPISVVCLVDKERQWFKSAKGTQVKETPREMAFCCEAIKQNDIFSINNMLEDQRYANHPLVVQGPKVRFYAGVPLISSKGYALGTICVLDMRPRQLTDEQVSALKKLAIQTVKLLELRKKNFQLQEANILIKSQQEHMINQAVKNSILELSEGVHRSMISPLLSIQGQSQILRSLIDDQSLTVETLKAELRHIDSTLVQMSFVTTSLGELLETQNQPEIETLDLGTFLNDSSQLLAGYFKTLGIELKVYPFATTLLDSSPTMLKKVLLTLIIHSIKAHSQHESEEPKWIEIKTEKTESEIFITVKDNGRKLTENEQLNLFKPFQTHDGTHPYPILDLYVANALMKELGGSLSTGEDLRSNVLKLSLPKQLLVA